jgi:hypothetical protein
MAYTTNPPGTTDYGLVRSAIAPTSANYASGRTSTAPGGVNYSAARTGAAPGAADLGLAQTSVAPASSSIAFNLTNQPADVLPFNGDIADLPPMPSAFIPSFVELSGAAGTLKTLTASAKDAAANRIVQGTVGGVLKTYQVRAGTDAEALPGIVHPANYDAATNSVVFVEC